MLRPACSDVYDRTMAAIAPVNLIDRYKRRIARHAQVIAILKIIDEKRKFYFEQEMRFRRLRDTPRSVLMTRQRSPNL